jgi:hypothetical protein
LLEKDVVIKIAGRIFLNLVGVDLWGWIQDLLMKADIPVHIHILCMISKENIISGFKSLQIKRRCKALADPTDFSCFGTILKSLSSKIEERLEVNHF